MHADDAFADGRLKGISHANALNNRRDGTSSGHRAQGVCMSLMTLLDKIAGPHQERQQTRKADYRSQVATITDGKEPDPELVDQVLTDNGKTLDDLRTAVELLIKCRELRQAVDQQAKLMKEREQIDRQLQQAGDELTAAHQLLHHKEVSTRDESAARTEAADLRYRAEHRESQIPDLESQMSDIRDQIIACERQEPTLRGRLLVP